jgi:hypothetical protein
MERPQRRCVCQQQIEFLPGIALPLRSNRKIGIVKARRVTHCFHSSLELVLTQNVDRVERRSPHGTGDAGMLIAKSNVSSEVPARQVD